MKMIFMGRKNYAAELLAWTVKQGIEVVAVCTDNQFPNSPTAAKAKQLGIPVISMEEAEALSEREPIDLVVSYLYWRKIRKPLIDNPTYGCINFHPAILPDWRGTAGYNVAILNKLSTWGATAHYVSPEIDAGNIIRIFDFKFDYRLETVKTLEKKTQEIQMELYKSVILDVMEKGILPSTEQKPEDGVYISRDQMEAMKKIDPEKDDIDLKIRAFWFPPYDGAYVTIQGKNYTLINRDILASLADENQTAIV